MLSPRSLAAPLPPPPPLGLAPLAPRSSVYFINRGLVQLLERMQPVGLLRDNENFGLDDWLTSLESGKPPVVQLTAKAIGYCDVMNLHLDTLAAILNADEQFQRKVASKELATVMSLGAAGKKARLRLRAGGGPGWKGNRNRQSTQGLGPLLGGNAESPPAQSGSSTAAGGGGARVGVGGGEAAAGGGSSCSSSHSAVTFAASASEGADKGLLDA
jgi:hypothetical protein